VLLQVRGPRREGVERELLPVHRRVERGDHRLRPGLQRGRLRRPGWLRRRVAPHLRVRGDLGLQGHPVQLPLLHAVGDSSPGLCGPAVDLLDGAKRANLAVHREVGGVEGPGKRSLERRGRGSLDVAQRLRQVAFRHPRVAEVRGGVHEAGHHLVRAVGRGPRSRSADEGHPLHLRRVRLVGRVGVGVIPLVRPHEELDPGNANDGVVEADVIAAAGRPVDVEAERVHRPVLLHHRLREVLATRPAARRVGQVDHVVRAPDVVEDRLREAVEVAGQVVRRLAHREERVVRAQRLAHHVHVDVDAPLPRDARVLLDELVGAGDLVRPQEVDRAAGPRQRTLGNQLVERAEDLQLHHAAAHVVVGAALHVTLEEVAGEDHSFGIGLASGDGAVDSLEPVRERLDLRPRPHDDLSPGTRCQLHVLEQLRPLPPRHVEADLQVRVLVRAAAVDHLVGVEVAVARVEGDHPRHSRRIEEFRGILACVRPHQGQRAAVLRGRPGLQRLLEGLGRHRRDVDDLAGHVGRGRPGRDECGVGPQPGDEPLLGLQGPELALGGVVECPRARVAFELHGVDAVAAGEVVDLLGLGEGGRELPAVAQPRGAGQQHLVVEDHLPGDLVGQQVEHRLRQRRPERRVRTGRRRRLRGSENREHQHEQQDGGRASHGSPLAGGGSGPGIGGARVLRDGTW